MSNTYFKCIKGIASNEIVMVVKGDVVKIGPYPIEEGIVHLEGVSGWCKGTELSFNPKLFVSNFEVMSPL